MVQQALAGSEYARSDDQNDDRASARFPWSWRLAWRWPGGWWSDGPARLAPMRLADGAWWVSGARGDRLVGASGL